MLSQIEKYFFKYSWIWIIFLHSISIFYAFWNNSYLLNDSIQYLTLSNNVLNNQSFSQLYFEPYFPDTQRTPGYSIFLILIFNSPFLVLFVQHILVFINAWLLFKISNLISPNKNTLIALLYLSFPYPAIFASFFLSETLFITLFLTSLLFLFEKKKLFSNLFLTLSIFVKPVAIVIFILYLIYSALVIFKSKNYKLILNLSGGILILISSLGIWSWRNYKIENEYTFSTLSKISVHYGRTGGLCPQSWDDPAWTASADNFWYQKYPFIPPKTYITSYQSEETEKINSKVFSLSLQLILENPLDFISLQIKGVIQMLIGVGKQASLVLSQNIYFSNTILFVQLIFNLFLYVLLMKSVFSFKKLNIESKLLIVSVFVIIIAQNTAWADGRYRMIADPIMLLLLNFVKKTKVLT